MQRIDVYWRDIPSQILIKRWRERQIFAEPPQAATIALQCGLARAAVMLILGVATGDYIDQSDSAPHALAEALGRDRATVFG